MEIYIKLKGEDEGYKRIELGDFTDKDKIPEFNHAIKWKRYVDKPPRRRVESHREGKGSKPSLQNQPTVDNSGTSTGRTKDPVNVLVRANSNSKNSVSKRQRVIISADSSNDDEMTEEPMADDTENKTLSEDEL